MQIDWEIIDGAINNSLSPEQQAKFDSWLNASDANKSLYAKFLASYHDADISFPTQSSHDDQRQLLVNSLSKYAKRRIQNRVIGWTVGVAAVLILGLFVLYSVETRIVSNEIVAQSTTTSDANHNVLLITSSGDNVALPSVGDSIIVDGTMVANSDKGLVYSNSSATQNVENKLIIPRGQTFALTLSDGTKVWLNSDSELRYPVSFGDKNRVVSLKGEAYFEVVKNNTPFIVTTQGVEVHVMGTEFNVRSYYDESNTSVTLANGAVSLKSLSKGETMILKPGEQANVVKNNGHITKCDVDPYQYVAWRDDRFVFNSISVQELVASLERVYDVSIDYHGIDQKLFFTGDLKKSDGIMSILKIIESNGLVTFSVDGRNIKMSVKDKASLIDE